MPSIPQRSFAGGEISPTLYSRADHVSYQTGVAKARNFYIKKDGGLTRRPGHRFVGPAKYNDRPVRLVPFVFSGDESYVVELGHQYLRLITQGRYVTETYKDVTAITQANPGVVTSASHGYSDGDIVYLTPNTITSTAHGMPEMWFNYFRVNNKTTNTFELQYPYGTDVDTTGFTAFTSGTLCYKVIEITTPYDSDDIFELTYTQIGDLMTLAHRDYDIQELVRNSSTSWGTAGSTTDKKLGAKPHTGVSGAIDIDGTASTAAATSASGLSYYLTAIYEAGGDEKPIAGLNIKDAEQEVVLTTGDATSGSYSVAGIPARLYGRTVTITITDATGYTLSDTIKVTGTDQYDNPQTEIFDLDDGTRVLANGQSQQGVKFFNSITAIETSTGGTDPQITVTLNAYRNWYPLPLSISWSGTAPDRVNIYRGPLQGRVQGYIGTFEPDGTSPDVWLDQGETPDYTRVRPYDRLWFGNSSDKRPGAVCYIQQRMALASSNNAPETIWLSRTGYPDNFLSSLIVQDDAAIEATLFSNRLNQVRHLLDDNGRLLAYGGDSVTVLRGNSAGIITPTDINAQTISDIGIGDVPPLSASGVPMYVASNGNRILTLSYEFQRDGYAGQDLTVMSDHLFNGYQIVDWTYQKEPDSLVWAVRDDGKLLCMTFLPEHKIWGWTQHDTFGYDTITYHESGSELEDYEVQVGAYLSVCSVPEGTVGSNFFTSVPSLGNRNTTYVAVRRTNGPEELQVYIEELDTPYKEVAGDHTQYDCSVRWRGENFQKIPVYLTTATTWTAGSAITLNLARTPSLPEVGFNDRAVLVGDKVVINYNGSSATLTVTTVAATALIGTADADVPAALQSMNNTTTDGSSTDWVIKKNEVLGLMHLEGEEVSIMADGATIANRIDGAGLYTTRTVANGKVSLGDHYARVCVGLPVVSDMKSLPIDRADASVIDLKKQVRKVTVGVVDSNSMYTSCEEPTGDDTNTMDKFTVGESRGGSTDILQTDWEDVQIRSAWDRTGQIFVRCNEGLPVTIMTLVPSVRFDGSE